MLSSISRYYYVVSTDTSPTRAATAHLQVSHGNEFGKREARYSGRAAAVADGGLVWRDRLHTVRFVPKHQVEKHSAPWVRPPTDGSHPHSEPWTRKAPNFPWELSRKVRHGENGNLSQQQSSSDPQIRPHTPNHRSNRTVLN